MRGFKFIFSILLMFQLLPMLANAEETCSRKLNVPVATIGFSVIANRTPIEGVYPDLLRGLKACQFSFSEVPRARLEAMFEAGKADLLMPATRTPKRDQHGLFVPLVASRPMVIFANPELANANAKFNLDQLLQQKNLRFAFVRGFDYGNAYQGFLHSLESQGRLTLEIDALAIGRLMRAGLVDASIMAPSILVAAIDGDARCQGLPGKLKFNAMLEFPWGESGIYISNQAVNKADQQLLSKLLRESVNSGLVWKTFQKYYSDDVLDGSIEPKH